MFDPKTFASVGGTFPAADSPTEGEARSIRHFPKLITPDDKGNTWCNFRIARVGSKKTQTEMYEKVDFSLVVEDGDNAGKYAEINVFLPVIENWQDEEGKYTAEEGAAKYRKAGGEIAALLSATGREWTGDYEETFLGGRLRAPSDPSYDVKYEDGSRDNGLWQGRYDEALAAHTAGTRKIASAWASNVVKVITKNGSLLVRPANAPSKDTAAVPPPSVPKNAPAEAPEETVRTTYADDADLPF